MLSKSTASKFSDAIWHRVKRLRSLSRKLTFSRLGVSINPSLAFSNPCFSVFLVYHLNSLHKIMSNIVFSEVASAFKSRVDQQPTRKTKMRGNKWRKFEGKKKRNYGKMRKDWGNVLILPILPIREWEAGYGPDHFPACQDIKVIACNSGTQMRVRDSSATRIFF